MWLISSVYREQGQIKTGAPCRSERLAKYNQVNIYTFVLSTKSLNMKLMLYKN